MDHGYLICLCSHQVVELSPSPAASVIDTDLEADVTPSEEVEAAVLAEQEAVRLRQEERNHMQALIRQQEEEKRQQEIEVVKTGMNTTLCARKGCPYHLTMTCPLVSLTFR